jgi:cyanate lyase
MPPRPFDAQALEDALDERRRAEGLSWAELGRRLHVAPSTMRGLAAQQVIEADGALAMVRWLGRSVESFTALPDAPPLPQGDWVTDGGFVRIGAARVHQALEMARTTRGLSWDEVARTITALGAPTATAGLTRLAKGGRMDVHQVVAICAWLGRPVAGFTRFSPA